MNLDVAIEQLFEFVNQVREASYVDDKTPLGNALALNKEAALIDTGNSNLDVVIFGDLNGFKHLNDTHGHDAGDVAIGQTGKKIQKEFVRTKTILGKAFRISGDEFVILIRRSALQAFKSKVSHFRSVKFQYEEKRLDARMSFGYAIGDRKTDFTELKKRAEAACLVAKQNGDGTCVEWSSDIEENALVELRRNCNRCNSVNRCNVPRQRADEGLRSCSFCGLAF